MLLEKRWQPISLTWAGAILLSAIIGILAKGRISSNTTALVMLVVGVIGFQGLALVWVHWFLKLHGVTWGQAFGFSRHNYGRCILIVLIALPLVLLAVFALSRVSELTLEHLHAALHWKWLKPQSQAPVELLQNDWPAYVIALQAVMTLLIAPFSEEILFRGILYTAIKQRGHRLLALGITSFIFALIHAYAVGFLSLVFLAVVLAALYEWTKNLFASILLHALFNTVNFILIVAHPAWAEKFFQP